MAPLPENVEDDEEVMSFFEKYSYDTFPSKHLKYLEIPAWDCREALEEEPVLHMSDKDLTDDDAVALSRAMSIIKPEQLLRLYMTRNKLTDKGCAALAAGCADCPNFELFYLQKNQIGDGGLAAIASTMKQSTMWQLVLTENVITDVGVKAFAASVADGKSFLKMKTLYLDTNVGITDEGCCALAKVPRAVTQHTHGPAQAAALASALSARARPRSLQVLHCMPELEVVALQKCSITDKGIYALAEAIAKGGVFTPGNNNWICESPRVVRCVRGAMARACLARVSARSSRRAEASSGDHSQMSLCDAPRRRLRQQIQRRGQGSAAGGLQGFVQGSRRLAPSHGRCRLRAVSERGVARAEGEGPRGRGAAGWEDVRWSEGRQLLPEGTCSRMCTPIIHTPPGSSCCSGSRPSRVPL